MEKNRAMLLGEKQRLAMKALQLYHAIGIALRRGWQRVVWLGLWPLGFLAPLERLLFRQPGGDSRDRKADGSASSSYDSEGDEAEEEMPWYEPRIEALDRAYAFFEVAPSVGECVCAEVTDHMARALRVHFERADRTRECPHVCDFLAMLDEDHMPIFPQFHFRLSTQSTPALNPDLHFGLLYRRASGRWEAHTNRSRPRLQLTNLDDLPDHPLADREGQYQVITVTNPKDDPIVSDVTALLKNLFRADQTYDESLPQLLGLYLGRHALDEQREDVAAKLARRTPATEPVMNPYERRVVEDMARGVRLMPQTLTCTVLDNAPRVINLIPPDPRPKHA